MTKLAYICLLCWAFVGGYEFGKKQYESLTDDLLRVTKKCTTRLERIVSSAGL